MLGRRESGRAVRLFAHRALVYYPSPRGFVCRAHFHRSARLEVWNLTEVQIYPEVFTANVCGMLADLDDEVLSGIVRHFGGDLPYGSGPRHRSPVLELRDAPVHAPELPEFGVARQRLQHQAVSSME
jgi:hypothetical protein